MCIDLPVGVEKGRDAVAAIIRKESAPLVPEPLRRGMLEVLAREPVEMCANHAIYTRHCTVPGAALLGDASGCSHPLTATGMTTGLNDVRILVEELDANPAIDTALARYEKRRYRFARARELLAEALYEIFRGTDDDTRALLEGILRYWESSARARSASLALLSGQDSRLSAFVTEYVRVLGQSTRTVLGRRSRSHSLLGRARTVSGVFSKSFEQLERTLLTAYEDVLR
jgi:hypothetical protein